MPTVFPLLVGCTGLLGGIESVGVAKEFGLPLIIFEDCLLSRPVGGWHLDIRGAVISVSGVQLEVQELLSSNPFSPIISTFFGDILLDDIGTPAGA